VATLGHLNQHRTRGRALVPDWGRYPAAGSPAAIRDDGIKAGGPRPLALGISARGAGHSAGRRFRHLPTAWLRTTPAGATSGRCLATSATLFELAPLTGRHRLAPLRTSKDIDQFKGGRQNGDKCCGYPRPRRARRHPPPGPAWSLRLGTSLRPSKRKEPPGVPGGPYALSAALASPQPQPNRYHHPTGAHSTNCDDPTHGLPLAAASDNETLDHLLSNVDGT